MPYYPRDYNPLEYTNSPNSIVQYKELVLKVKQEIHTWDLNLEFLENDSFLDESMETMMFRFRHKFFHHTQEQTRNYTFKVEVPGTWVDMLKSQVLRKYLLTRWVWKRWPPKYEIISKTVTATFTDVKKFPYIAIGQKSYSERYVQIQEDF